jgi:CIC family chloride channel protein
MPSLREWVFRRVETLRVPESAVLLTLAFAVGLGSGLAALGFKWLVESSKGFFFGPVPPVLMTVAPLAHLWTALIPMLGGLASGPLMTYFAPEARGHGVPEVMQSVALKGGIIRPRVAAVKAVASALCIGSGGSAGREGPIVQIGSAIGSTIGQVFRMTEERVKILVGCGAAGGIAAIFNAPFAGVLFSLEVILGDFSIKTFAPVILSAVLASVFMRSAVGDSPAFPVPPFAAVSGYDIPAYIVLGGLCGLVAVLFTRTLYWTEDRFEGMPLPIWIKPAIGGLGTGLVGLFFPQVFADGYDVIDTMLSGSVVIWLATALVVLKVLATSLTLGSGNSGGVFAPSLFMGAATGLAMGHAINQLFPSVAAPPGAYALVGMGAMLAGTMHAPLTAILMLFELTNDYRIILPVMVAVVFSTLVARRFCRDSIYSLKLRRGGIVLKYGRDINVLARVPVRDVMSTRLSPIPEDAPLPEVLRHISAGEGDIFPVVSAKGELVGTIGFQDVRRWLVERALDEVVVAHDLARTDVPVLDAGQDLETAMEKFGPQGFEALPVLDGREGKLVGLLHRDAVTSFYNRRLLERLSD